MPWPTNFAAATIPEILNDRNCSRFVFYFCFHLLSFHFLGWDSATPCAFVKMKTRRTTIRVRGAHTLFLMNFSRYRSLRPPFETLYASCLVPGQIFLFRLRRKRKIRKKKTRKQFITLCNFEQFIGTRTF